MNDNPYLNSFGGCPAPLGAAPSPFIPDINRGSTPTYRFRFKHKKTGEPLVPIVGDKVQFVIKKKYSTEDADADLFKEVVVPDDEDAAKAEVLVSLDVGDTDIPPGKYVLVVRKVTPNPDEDVVVIIRQVIKILEN